MTILDLNGKRVIIAKTIHLGDVIISLPLAAVIKQHYPQCQVLFLASGPACKLAEMYSDIDEVYDWEVINKNGPQQAALALKQLNADVFLHINPSRYLAKVVKQAHIPIRVGSIYRWYNWFTCNRLAVISRDFAKYNKRELDLQYLAPLGIKRHYSYAELCDLYQFKKKELPLHVQRWLDPAKFKLILHPALITSKIYRWPIEHYSALIEQLPQDRYQIFISGTPNDRELLQPLLDKHPHVQDLIGKLPLDEYISFLQHCDGLIAGSTGPLHIAAAAGIHALGIYCANPVDMKRWEPVGKKAEVIFPDIPCHPCPNDDPCQCMWSITPERVRKCVEAWRR